MGKLIMKTALITLSVTFVLAISVFGIVSFSAPGAMMSFSASLGMESVSGDYAFAEYERSGNLSCLVRAAETAEKANALSSADERFTLLLKDEKFPAYCAEKDGEAAAPISYKQYVYGLAAGVKYRLGDREGALRLALESAEEGASGKKLPYAVIEIAVKAQEKKDAPFCKTFAEWLRTSGFEESKTLQDIINLLEECANE